MAECTDPEKKDLPPVFWADKTVGKLAIYLRLLGFDCADRDFKSPDENRDFGGGRRVFLTRNRKTAEQTRLLGIAVQWLGSDRTLEQLAEINRKWHLNRFDDLKARCPRCNMLLARMSPSDLDFQVPEYIRNTRQSFLQCPDCGRIFWQGTHIIRFKERLKHVLDK